MLIDCLLPMLRTGRYTGAHSRPRAGLASSLYLGGLWLCLGGLWLWASLASAQGLTREKLTASYLYNFAKNIQWPNEQGLKQFKIGVYESSDARLFDELQTMATRVRVRSLPIQVDKLSATSALTSYQLIFIDPQATKNITALYDRLDSKPVLLVTSEFSNKQLVMINLITDADRLKFEVNKSNLINHGLTPLPELILNGGTEIDVAKLYREGQASLVAMQKQLQSRERALDELANTIKSQEAINQRLQQQLGGLQQNIHDSDALISKQNEQLQEQKKQIDQSRQERERLLQEVDARTQELNQQQASLNKIAAEIDQREKRLAQLNQTILTQEQEISSQKAAIAGLDQQVDAQKVSLKYLRGLVILGALLIITIVIAYNTKRLANQRLAARSKDLQIAGERLAIAKRKAEDASQAKSEFLSLMSHELRTPLQSIIGYTELVIEELKMEDDHKHVDDLTRVITNGERLLKLINGVLDLAKIEAGRMELDLTEVRLSSLVDEALGAVGSLLEKSRIQVQKEVDDGASLPLADPEKILHILINLLGNACKFSQDGQVQVKALHQESRIYISIADTGIGMTAEQQQHIFDPFRQADSSTTRKYQGSGLGLSITRQLCELMGGSIRVESELGKGACFIVEIPLPIANAHKQPALAPVAAAPVNDFDLDDVHDHLVIIEPEPVLLEVLARGLQQEPVQLHGAPDALGGLQLARELKPRAIVLDLHLPNQQAWVFLEKMRAQHELATIPVMAVSLMDGGALVKQGSDPAAQAWEREVIRLAIKRLAGLN